MKTFNFKSLFLGIFGVLILGFQNCAPAKFSGEQTASLGPTAAAPGVGTNSCSASKGQICATTKTQHAPGCQQGYGCAAFEGIYYDSPSGCSSSASSFVEYRFDGTYELSRGKAADGTPIPESIIG